MNRFAKMCRKGALGLAVAAFAVLGTAPTVSQSIETVDPDVAIDADLSQPQTTVAANATPGFEPGLSATVTRRIATSRPATVIPMPRWTCRLKPIPTPCG